MIQKALNLDEMKKTFKREDQNKQSVSRTDPSAKRRFTEMRRKKRYWRNTLLHKQQSFMFCVWMNMSQGLIQENAKYRGTSKSVGGGPWNASQENEWWLTVDSCRETKCSCEMTMLMFLMTKMEAEKDRRMEDQTNGQSAGLVNTSYWVKSLPWS